MIKLPGPEDIESEALLRGKRKMGEVCAAAGIAPNTFSRWRTGKVSPTFKTVQALLDEIYRDNGEREAQP